MQNTITRKGLTLDPAQATWRKSSFSGGNTDACVEVAMLDGGVALRDSKNRDGDVLLFDHAEWEAFRNGLAAGEFLE